MTDLFSVLLVQKIQECASYKERRMHFSGKIKIQNAVSKLEEFSKKSSQPLSFFINSFADFYVNYLGEKSFCSIYSRIGEFSVWLNVLSLPKFSNDDVEFASFVDKEWNEMHRTVSNDFPFRIHTYLNQSKIKIKENTYFRHSKSFVSFCLISKFVNAHRLNFPQIHSLKEFFLHLPIVTKFGREYFISEYLNPESSLEKYYKMVYGNCLKKERLMNYLKTLSVDSVEEFKTSKMWCAKEALEHLNSFCKINENK